MKESLIMEVYLGNLVICTSEEYRDFVREAIINEREKHHYAGNTSVVSILNTEINRLDELHVKSKMVA